MGYVKLDRRGSSTSGGQVADHHCVVPAFPTTFKGHVKAKIVALEEVVGIVVTCGCAGQIEWWLCVQVKRMVMNGRYVE